MTEQVEEAVTFIQSLNPNELKMAKPKAEKNLDELELWKLEEAPCGNGMAKMKNEQVEEYQAQVSKAEIEAQRTEEITPLNNKEP